MLRRISIVTVVMFFIGCQTVRAPDGNSSREPSSETIKPLSDKEVERLLIPDGVLKKFDVQVTLAKLKPAKPSTVTILQVNDVYEVEPSESGTRGGLARIATLRSKLEIQSPALRLKGTDPEIKRVLAILPGDFISPSAIGASIEIKNGKHVYEKVNGKDVPLRVAGRHMVKGLRAAGMDIVSFGNHEFDYAIKDTKDPRFGFANTSLLSRIEEYTAERKVDPKGSRSKPLVFSPYGTLEKPQWLAGNVKLNLPPKSEMGMNSEPYIWNTQIALGQELIPVKIGVISICLPWPTKEATFEGATKELPDVFAAAERQISALEKQGVHGIIAMTHESMENDLRFAAQFKGRVHLIAGGHEHDRQFGGVRVDQSHALMVTKADANAKSAYIHQIQFQKNPQTGAVVLEQVNSSWIEVNDQLVSDPQVKAVTAIAEAEAKDSFRLLPFTREHKYAPNRVIWKTVNNLDGRESKIRSQKTHLSELIGRSITARAYRIQKSKDTPAPELVVGAIYHGGTIRIDDQLMSTSGIQSLLSKQNFATKVSHCENPANCLPQGDPRCEKKELCPGELSEYDVLRIAPFDGTVVTWMALTGQQIRDLYACNDHNSGTGSYLHFSNFYQCQSPTGLCYREPDREGAEFTLTAKEMPVSAQSMYMVASLDFFTHIALPNHKILSKNPPMTFPPKKDLMENPEFRKNWILDNDIRRAIVEEPLAKEGWAHQVTSDPDVEKNLGYGPQPPLKGPIQKRPECTY